MNYEQLLKEADKLNLIVKEASLKTKDGLCCGNKIIINQNLSSVEKYCVLCEELGHYHLTIGDITNQTNINNAKQEKLARKWGYEKSVGLLKLIDAFENGCCNKYEIAVFLGITESYLEEALEYHRSKYGIDYIIDCYYIRFIPNFNITKVFY